MNVRLLIVDSIFKPMFKLNMSNRTIKSVLFLIIIMMSGCGRGVEDTLNDRIAGEIGTATGTVSARWPFWPTRMRIHPLTSLSLDSNDGDPFIEARIEFKDRFADVVKSDAQFRFELHEGKPDQGPGKPLRIWNVDLRNLEQNELHWDTVTRTYLFKLTLSNTTVEEGNYLRAYVLSVDGTQFNSIYKLR